MSNRKGFTRRHAIIALLAGGALALPGFVPAAAAADWHWGGSFRIGGLQFRIGHHPTYSGHYYYRTRSHIPSRHRCTTYCRVDRGYRYHHRSCPVVLGHFHRHRIYVEDLWFRFAPARRDWRHDRYDRYHRYDRYDRFDRYDRRDRRYRYDRDRYRYDRRHDRGHHYRDDRDRKRYRDDRRRYRDDRRRYDD